ncbi:rubrerythrin [Rhodobacter aestuarii]|uniref:Rubrerythrin n=1 Tax=Rhodobacter aestuarii TaxID=453582 RepID=A0A1N7LZQ3_9RHOB|nr:MULTISPECIES: ferritin family protein [Rhodobacter]PTV94745.1 rubrerythrin [Rhodobacter aestuarii]SIS79325.1 Rubrerythrin [Rhodobacter aestuarii]SOC14620.1 rubrerythrin [Rhodobacter sp. JA431]
MSEANKERLLGKTTVREIFEVATEFERVAHRFYSELVPKVSKDLRWLVEELAEEEAEHIRIFTELAQNPAVEAVLAEEITRPVADPKFSDCVQTPDLGPNPDDQAVLQYALMRETAAMEQYTELAKTAPAGPLRDAFLFLAKEETEHKAELEKTYYEVVHSGGV